MVAFFLCIKHLNIITEYNSYFKIITNLKILLYSESWYPLNCVKFYPDVISPPLLHHCSRCMQGTSMKKGRSMPSHIIVQSCTDCMHVYIYICIYIACIYTNVHTEKSIPNLVKTNQIWIVNTLFRFTWNQTEFRLVPNSSINSRDNVKVD